MRIGIDIDGVVANFVAALVPLVKNRYGLALRERDIYVHDLDLVLGVMQYEVMDLVRQAIKCDLEPYPGAILGLRRLRRQHEVTLVTSRPVDMMDVTKAWLSRRGIPHDDLLHFGEGSKHHNELGFHVFVDDHLRETFGFVGKVPCIIIFDRPWNRTFNAGGLFKRAHNWRELVSIIETYRAAANDPEVVTLPEVYPHTKQDDQH